MRAVISHEVVTELSDSSVAQRQQALDYFAASRDHAGVAAAFKALQQVQVRPAEGKGALKFPFNVAAWNLERCYFPDASAELLKEQNPQIVLLSEVDSGMARTKQVHTSFEIARRLDMAAAFGVEFLELNLGGDKERSFCDDDFNRRGYHGNALLSGAELTDIHMLRFDAGGFWFRPKTREVRLGDRCAILGVLASEAGPILFCSVHLESDADQHFRAQQMLLLFAHIDSVYPNLPVVIGGDLNTGLSTAGDFDREPLFAEAQNRGFERFSGQGRDVTTRASMISPDPERAWKLDWFLVRGLSVASSRIVAAIDRSGKPLSDHELITIEVTGLSQK